jgi:dienelactone hydrolase
VGTGVVTALVSRRRISIAAGVDWRLVVYGGALHAFHHPPVGHPVVPGVGYHPRHAQRAWRDVVDLLAECLPVTE